MCGLIGYSGDFHTTALQSGLAAIGHRGPDGSGIFLDRSLGIGLGHARLAILDLSPQGHQPMANADGRVVLVFNGEIYNFRELRAGLVSRGHAFRGHSDTEVLLNLYLAEGEGMLPKLNGIFAFALWDSRSHSLLLARDGLGVKPLYFAATEAGLAFASEIKGLLHLVPEVRALDTPALDRYLSFLWCPGEGTPFKGVRKLKPGEALTARAGRIERQWNWYRLPQFRAVKGDLDESSVLAGTLEGLRRAVERQLVADVPVGAFLSGGLDSSAIVALAREQNPDIRCFTINVADGIEEGAVDDLPYARRVAKHLGVHLEEIRIDAARMAGDLENMVAQLDEPLADPAPLNVLYISQLARQHGIKVLLSGAGGDDLFSGYRRHWALTTERYWSWLPEPARAGLEWVTEGLDQRRPLSRRLRKLFNGASLDGDARLVNYFRWVGRKDLASLYTTEFRAALGDAHAEDPMIAFLAELPMDTSRFERMLALEQRFFLTDHNLNYTDKMSMAVGVEVRVPFLDNDLVEFAAQIPHGYKQRGREGKWVLKKAMEPFLPRDVIYRPKTGFGAPVRRWMRFELRELLGDLLSAESLGHRGLFDPAAVQRLIEDNDAGRVDASYTLLSLLCIEIWCRAYLGLHAPARFDGVEVG